MKNYNIKDLLDQHNISAYYNIYCPITLQAQSMVDWKEYYFPDFTSYDSGDKYTCKNLGFRDELIVTKDGYQEFTDSATEKIKTWESGTRFISHYRPKNSTDNADNPTRSVESNYLIILPSANYFYVPTYFTITSDEEGSGSSQVTAYGFKYYFDSDTTIARFGYRNVITDGGVPHYIGYNVTQTLQQKGAFSGVDVYFLHKKPSLNPSKVLVVESVQATSTFPRPMEELVTCADNKIETVSTSTQVYFYGDLDEDLLRRGYKFIYQPVALDTDDDWWINKTYLSTCHLILV